jgi:hypothetical protein
MSQYADHLWQDLLREHGPRLARAERRPSHIFRRPRVLPVGAIGLAGVGTAIMLTLGGATPAYAITTNGNDSILVTLNQTSALPEVNAKLASMGTDEQISIQMANGPAAFSGPVECTASTSAPSVSGPRVSVVVGTDGTEVIPSHNTGAGTWHLAACYIDSTGTQSSANTGNTGNG